jgi:NAD(P)-dependent dehydrogenase (short-subunit alcohol dehydrogenase family)
MTIDLTAMRGKRVVVTGASSGIGLAAATLLAEAGVDVIAVARTEETAARARAEILGRAPTARLHVFSADLSSHEETRALARHIASQFDGLDALLNNAGAAFARYAATKDGVERGIAVGYHAPMLLSHLLFDHLRARGGRIVNVSSAMAGQASVDAAALDLDGEALRDRFGQMRAYGKAKLLLLLATGAMARRLPAGMLAMSADPGAVRTAFAARAGGVMRFMTMLATPFLAVPSAGARTPLRLLAAPANALRNGGLYAKEKEVALPKAARDEALADRLYDATTARLGLPPLRRGAPLE